MAGHAHVKVEDAAIERQSLMRENQYKYFRWTSRTLRSTFWAGIFLPAGLFVSIWAANDKWKWTGKGRDQTLSKHA